MFRGYVPSFDTHGDLGFVRRDINSERHCAVKKHVAEELPSNSRNGQPGKIEVDIGEREQKGTPLLHPSGHAMLVRHVTMGGFRYEFLLHILYSAEVCK